jgi:hypothetical protein
MYELLLIWKKSVDEPEKFIGKIRVHPLPDTCIHTIAGRLEFAAYWKKQRDEIRAIIDEHGVNVLGPTDLKNWKNIQEFALHVNEMLCHISDVLLEGNLDKFIAQAIIDLK